MKIADNAIAAPDPRSSAWRRYAPTVMTLVLVFSVALVLWIGWDFMALDNDLKLIGRRDHRLIELSGKIIHLDEVLTMSARMSAATLDPAWEKRYLAYEPELDNAIKQSMEIDPQTLGDFVSQTDVANRELVKMEHDAFDLVRKGDGKAASAILFSLEYASQKRKYAEGMQRLAAFIDTRAHAELANQQQHVVGVFAAVLGLLAALSLFWLVLLRTAKKRAEAEYREKLVAEKAWDEMEVRVKEATEAVRQNEARLNAMLQANPDIMVIMDRELNILWANDSIRQVFGQDLAGKKCYAVLHGLAEPCDQASCLVAQTFRDGKGHDGDRIVVNPDGKVMHMHCTANPAMLDPDGNPEAVIEVLRDVSQQKSVEEALVESRRRLRAMLDNIPDMAWLKDKEGRLIAVNQAFARSCGRQIEDVVGKSDLDIWPRNIAESYIADDLEVMRSGQHRRVEEPMQGPDGVTRWIETIKTPMFNLHGGIEGTTGIARDITVRKEMQQKMQDSELRLRTLLNSITSGVVIVDPRTHTISDANEAALKLLGRPADKVVGLPCSGLSCDRKTGQCPVKDLGEFASTSEQTYTHPDGRKVKVVKTTRKVVLDKSEYILETLTDITDRKRAEERLRFQNILLETEQEVSIDGILVVDEQGLILSFNQRFADMWALPPELFASHQDEPILKGVMQRVQAPDRFLAEVERIYKNQDAATRDEVALKDGRIFDRYSAPMIGQDGAYYGRVWNFRDITDQKRAEQALRESEQKYAELVEQSPDAIALLTCQGVVASVNKASLRNSGLTADDMVGKHFSELHHIADDTILRCKEEFTRLLAGEERPPFDMITIGPDGTNVYEANPRVVRRGSEITGVQVIMRDITDRKRAEERIRKLNRLQAELLKPGTLDEQLKLITDGVVDTFNADFARIWITQPGDLCDSGCMHAGVTEGPHVCTRRDLCLRLRASSGRYTHTDGGHRRVPFGCYKIGQIVADRDSKFLTNDVIHDPRVHDHEWASGLGLVSFAGYQIRPPGEQTSGVLALFSKHPITADEDAMLESLAHTTAQVVQAQTAREAEELAKREVEKRAIELAKLNIKLERAIKDKNEFLRAVSHDLSAPLRNIAGMASFLKTRYGSMLDDVGRDRVDRIMKNIKVQTTLIDDLLELSRIKTRRGRIEFTDLNQVFHGVVEQLAFDIEKKSGLVELDGTLPSIWCESNRLRQVFQNLVDNAVKYAHPDRPCRVLVSVAQDPGYYRFTFKDNGIGMRPEDAEKAFFVFQRARNAFTAQIEGKGVGLASVKSIVENYEGEISVESREGLGSAFTFTLARSVVDVPPPESDPSSVETGAEASNS